MGRWMYRSDSLIGVKHNLLFYSDVNCVSSLRKLTIIPFPLISFSKLEILLLVNNIELPEVAILIVISGLLVI
jgi:hypothetical protein